VRQRCAGLNRTGLAGPPQDGPQDNIAAEFSVAADAASQNRAKRDFGFSSLKHTKYRIPRRDDSSICPHTSA